MDLYLRKIREGDIEAVAAMEAACFSDPWSLGLVGELLGSEFDETWILEGQEEGEEIPWPVGYINFRLLAGEGELMRIAVLPPFRGMGYSRKLMDRLEKSAVEAGAGELTLEVRAGNRAAISLYKSYGFKEEALRKNYYQNPREDALIMWRRDFLAIPT